MVTLVTGGAGFIGSCAVKTLLSHGEQVKIVDNLSTGRMEFIEDMVDGDRCTFVKGDILDTKMLSRNMEGVDAVWHLASNPDIRLAENDQGVDLKQGVLATHSVLESMRISGAKNILFSSSSVVYGEADVIPTPEDYGPLLPISLYGAAKLGAEGLITAYCHSHGLKAQIFRFANVVGKNQTHGVVYDFIAKLRKTPGRLEVLGNGKQAKSYLLVEDCVNGMLHTYKTSRKDVDVYNLGGIGRTPVHMIAEMVRNAVSPSARIEFTGTDRGWTGDVRQMELSIDKILSTGWKPSCNSHEAVEKSMRTMLEDA